MAALAALIRADRPSWNPDETMLALWSESLRPFSAGQLRRAGFRFLESEKGPPSLARIRAFLDADMTVPAPQQTYESRDTRFEDDRAEHRRLAELAFTTFPGVIPPGPDRDAYLEMCRVRGWTPYTGPGSLVGTGRFTSSGPGLPQDRTKGLGPIPRSSISEIISEGSTGGVRAWEA